MPSKHYDELRRKALQMPRGDRAELAADLLTSFDEQAESEPAAWERELLARAGELDAGTTAIIEVEQLRRRLRDAGG
jgi:putative addiction module component (TIGR02574 family)